MSKKTKKNQEQKNLVGITYDEYKEKHGGANSSGLTGVSYEEYQKRDQQRRLKAQQKRADELLKRQNTVKKMDNQNAATILRQQNKKRDQLADAAKARARFVNQYTFGQLPEINKRNAEYQAKQKQNERVDALLRKQDTVKNWQGKNAGVISAEKKQQNTVGADELKSIASKASATDAIGQYGKGNIDLWNRPVVKNGDGSVSTVKSFSTNIDGKEVLLPLIVNGKEVSEEEAIQHYLDTGEYLGKFDSIADADAYGRMLHNQQEALYGSGAGENRFSVEDVDADFDALKKAQEREPLTGKQFDQASLDAQKADPKSRLNRYKRITTMNQLGLTPDPANIPATVEWINEMQDLGLLNDSDDPMYWTDWKIQHTIEENNKKIAEIEARNDELKEKSQAERDEEVQGTYDLQQKATIYKNLADYGVPISWGPDQYFFMGSNVEESHVKERPEDYWQDGRREEYDRGLYDYINGEGAYDSRIRSMTTEGEQLALDEEMDQLWSAIEDGNIRNMADQAIGEYTEDAAKYGVGTEELYRQNEMLEDLLDQRLTQKNYMAMAEGGDTAYHPEAIKTNEVADNTYTRMVEAEMMGIPFVGTSFVGGKYQDGDEIDKIYFDVNNPFGDLEGQIQDWKYDGTLWENLQRVSEAYFMTQEQKDAFNSLYNAGKKEEAKAFYDALNRSYLSQMKMNYREDTLGKLASGKEGWQMGLYTIFSKMANDTMATYGSIRALLGDKEYQDKKNPIYQGVREDQIIRNNRIKAWGNKFAEWFGEDARGTGEWLGEQNFSLWDNVFRTVVSAGFGGSGTTGAILNELMMGDEVFGESMYEALSEDKSLTESFVVSLGRSLVESLTEHMGWDALFNADIKDVLSSGWKFAKYLGMNFASEAAEEATSHVMDTLLDEAAATIWNHRSELMEKMNYYMKQEGLTQEEASNKVWTEWLEEGGLAALGGGLTGLLSSGGYAGMARASYGSQTKQLGRDVLNRGLEDLQQNIKPGANLAEETKNLQLGNLNTIIDASSKLGENTESRKTAESIQEDMRNGKKIDLRKVGELVRNISLETSEEIGNIAKNVLGDTIKDQLTEKGVKANKAGALSDTLVRLITGDYTEEDMKMLVRSKEAQSLLAEYGMGQHDDQLNELKERTKEIAETRNSVMEMMVDPKQTARGITEKAIGDLMKGAKWATAEEITAADAAGGKTGKATEIIHDGKYAEITGFGTREVTEDGKKIPVATVTLSNGKTVDLTDIRPTSERQAQILQFVQSDSGSTIMAETGKALMQIGGKVQNIASAVTDTVNIVFDMFTGKQNTKTKLDTATEQEIRAAVQKDMDAADAARLNNYVELKPGQGKTTFKGVVYGSKAFDETLKAAGFSKSLRNEANAIASISKSLGTNVELYYDANESGNQGAFYGGQGIRINLAGTYNAEGVHRSALATFAHEVTHNLEANSAEAYKGLRRFVLQNLGKMGMNLQEELQRIMKNYAAHNENINLSGAIAEIVAMGSEQVLTNENVVSKLKEEDPSLFGKVRGAVQEMVNRIRLARNTAQETSSRYAKALQAVNDQVGKIWLEAAKEAQGAKGVAVGAVEKGQLSLASYTKDEEQSITRDRRNTIYDGNRSSFTSFYNRGLNAKNDIEKMYFGKIDHTLAARIKTDTGVELEGYDLVLANHEIRKISVIDHGSPIKEAKRGQVVIGEQELFDAIKVITEYDSAELDSKPYMGLPLINFKKNINGVETVAAYTATGKGELRIETVYKGVNKNGSLSAVRGVTSSPLTSLTGRGPTSNNNVSQQQNNGNSQNSFQEDQDQAYAEAVERGDWLEAAKEAQGAKGDAVGTGKVQNAFRDEEGNEIAFTEEIKNKNRNTVAASKPIIEIDQETIDRFKGGDLLTKGAEYFDEIGRIARNNVLGNVELANSGLRHWIGKGDASTIKARTIPAIKAVIEKGEVVHIDNQHKGKPVDTAVVAGKVKMPDGQYYVGVIVAQDNGGTRGQKNRYSFHNAIVIKEGNSEGSMVYTAEAADSVTSSAVSSVISILRDIEKRNSQKFIQEDQDQAYAEAVERGDWREAERMLLEKMQNTPGITGYNAPHFYAGEHKDIAKMIKNGDAETIRQVVEDMAPRIPDNAVLIPMPPHEGKVLDTTDTYILANALSKATGAPVIKALESDYHESRYKAKAAGDRSVNAQSMGFRQVAEIPEGKMPVFIDNMVGGGQTAMAAKNAIGRGITLAYAQSSRSKSQGDKYTSVTYDENGKLIPLSQRMDPNNKSWKYSFQDDQDYMAAVNAGDMETTQRMVEEAAKAAGYTKKVYHGTPTGGFTVFRDWSYFTENKDYADRYQNASASSIRGSYETTNPMTYALYMNPGKVFDTRKPAAAKLYNEARMEYGLGELGNTDSGLPDWTDGRDIIEFIEDRGLDYDTILLDEGGDPGENGPTKRGISYVTRANNVKNADPVTYDSKGKIVKLSDRFNRESNNIQFSMQDPVEVNKAGLIAVHNLTKKNLIDTLKEGGFTAPSIAVVLAKMGHSKFGPISAVFKPSAIDPRRSVKNKIYGTDAWTPTRSNAQIETKLDYQVLQDAKDTIESLLQDERDVWKNEAMNWINQWLYEDKTTDTLEEMIEKASRNDGMVAAFEIAQGRELKEKTRAEKVRSDLYADKVHIYEDFLNHLEEKGMLQEFLNDLHNVNGNVMLDKYIDLFAESNDVAAKQVKAYKEKSEGLAKRVIFNTMRQSGIYEEDGREIKMVDVFNKIDTANSIRRQWIENKSRRDEFNNWVTGLIGKALGKKGVYNGKEQFTSSGNKRSFEALHMEPTAENIVKAMYTNHPAKGGEAGGATGLMAKASKEYGSLQDVREDAARLQMIQDEEYKKLINALDDKLSDFVQRVSDGIGLDYYTIKEELIEAAGNYAKNPTAAAIRRYMEKEGIKLTAEQLIEAQELMEEARNIPTGYFEAKPESVKGFDELQTIIMAEDEELEQMLTERGIHYDIYDGTEEDRLRILNEQTDAQFSFMDETDVDARAWMETVNENSLQTEAEKQLLRNFKSLRMRVSLKKEQEENIQKEIRRMKDVLNGGGEGAAIETIENALEAIGIGIKYTRTARYITKDGAIIGKMAGRNGVRLNSSQAAVAAELEKAGFAYDKLTNIYTYANKTRRTMGQTQIEQKLKGLQARLEKATQEKQAAQDELAKITSSNGYASLMYRQQRVLNDFVYGRTQDEVRGAVDRLEKSAANIAKRIEEEQRKAEEQAKNSVVQRFREILGTTTVDQTAAALKKRYNSTWTKNQLKVYLEPIILKMKAGEDFTVDVETLAGILVNSDSTNTYEELSGLRGLVITLGPGAQKELRASNSSLKEIRARLAGTGIQVKFGERSSLETDIEDLRAEYPSIPELGDEKDALENFVSWVEGMKSQSAANEFYEQRIAEAMAVITQQAAGAAKGIYMPTDPKAAKQVLTMMEFVKGLSAETQAAQKMLQDVAKDMDELQKAGRQASGMAVTLTHDATTAIDYFNRMARIAQDQAKQKTRKDLIEQLKSDFAQKVAKSNEEWRNLIERDAQARKQMEKNMSSRGQINTVIKRLYDLLKNPKGTRNIPEHMQGLAREIVGVIVENDLSEMKHKISRIEKKNLMEAQRVLQAWEARDGKFNMADLTDMDPENASMLVINQDLEQIYDGIEKFNQEIRGKNKLDTLQQRGEILTQIQEAMSEIYTAIRAEGEVFLRGRKVATEDAAAEVMKGTGGKKYREWTGTAGRALAMMHKAIVSGNMTPEYFFRTIGNKGLNDLWENYHAAENRNGLELAKAKARLDEIAKKYGYEKWDTKERHTVHLMNGDVQMTLGQIMALWATWNRENTLGPEMSNHLTGGGFHVEQKDLREGLIGRTEVEQKSIKLAETDVETGYNPDIQEIESLMTQEQKDYVNDIVQFMSNDMSALGNEASMAAYGIRMYKEKYYFPFQMWDGIKSRKSNEAAQGANVDRAFHPSFSKSRMHGANNALVIGDFTQTAADHIAGMINYATMGLANESLQKVLNQQVQEGGELDQTKRNIRVILEEAYGQEATQYLLELQRQLNGGAVKVQRTLYDKAISMFRKNAVAGSLSVAFQQPLSYIRAAMLINPKYLAEAATREYWKGSYQELMAHSGVAVIKDMGRFDMNAGQSAREYLMPDELKSKGRKAYETAEEYLTILPEKMDAWTWTRMWVAVKLEQKVQHPEMDVKSDEFLDMCGERFNEIMRRTQVYDSVLVKSANMRSQHPAIKSITSFMAEPTLTINVLADAVRSAKSGEAGGKALLAKAGATFMLSAVMQSLIKALFSTGRMPDKKKTWMENLAYRFTGNIISEANPLSMIPGYSDLVTLLKEGKLQDDAMGAIGKVFTAVFKTRDILLNGSDNGLYRDIEDSAAQLVQLFSNIPAKNIMREVRAMYNWFLNGEAYASRDTNINTLKYQTEQALLNADNLLSVALDKAGFKVTNTAYYSRIYQAKKAGDETTAKNLIDYLLTGKGVNQKAIDDGILKLAKEDESLSVDERVDLISADGDDANATWWKLDRDDYKKATGRDPGSNSYYHWLTDAVNANKAEDIKTAVENLLKHGITKEQIKKKLSDWKSDYLAADSNGRVRIKDALQKAYRVAGYMAEDADKTISKWVKDAKKNK